MLRLLIVALALLIADAARAEDPALTDLHNTLVPLRGQEPDYIKTFGGGPEFDSIKHQLRDWVGHHLPSEYPTENRARDLARQLNEALRQDDLFCPPEDTPADPCLSKWQFYGRGFLGPVSLELRDFHHAGRFVLVETVNGIACGFDVSAYLYEWTDGHWQLRWQDEQTDYTPGKYQPRYFTDIHISPPYRSKPTPLVLTLGINPHCQ